MPSSFIEMLDAEPIQPTSTEYIAAWWDESMDASSWWTNESITPLHAALILSGHNPNDGTDNFVLATAETTTSGGIGPNEFRGLKNTFEGVSNGQPRTLRDWVKYAQHHKKKMHSWLGEWLQASGSTIEIMTESLGAELTLSPDSEILLLMPDATPASGLSSAAGLPLFSAGILLPENDDGLKQRERQIRAIESAAIEQGFKVLSIPNGGKTLLRKKCMSEHPKLFGGGPDPFNDAWKAASQSEPPRLRMDNHNKYSGR